ncbi:hypothetical protein OUZ56_012407 [Daphnia magna]|uniref:HTH psq-type domain-containing protein n=1 Tax=Daphnia magna TaxID=35525 RepID=A0ABQ9Z2X0_9CRUS|nr:hypothetical protein OUZ56_012407 [Daphnia magna]
MTHGEGWPLFHGASWPTWVHLSKKMRNYVRKTDRVKAPSDVIDRAVAKVLDEGKSVSSEAILFNIPRRSLTRFVENKKKSGLEEQNRPNSVFPTHHGYSSARQVFNKEDEALLAITFIVQQIFILDCPQLMLESWLLMLPQKNLKIPPS